MHTSERRVAVNISDGSAAHTVKWVTVDSRLCSCVPEHRSGSAATASDLGGTSRHDFNAVAADCAAPHMGMREGLPSLGM